MPLIDVTCPVGAIADEARASAMEALTAALIRAEGAPDTELTRALTWVFWHQVPDGCVSVGGQRPLQPVYRVFVTVPEGTGLHGPSPFGNESRRQLVGEVTEILLAAEGQVRDSSDLGRVYCIVREVSDGYWGALGTTFRMEEIAAIAEGRTADDAVVLQVQGAIDKVVSVEASV
jgi:phenylpyruvate tautomerase PptA (4-oxalocrotonate tautomerase family)